MNTKIETLYNEFIADEKLKNGTKYERMAAVVFKILNVNDVVIHDMKLRGDGKKTAHQIDVTIEQASVSKRILIECKDYDKTVGISIIRDFFGAVSQIKPDDAIVVTTMGYTQGARSFAEDEDIKLAILKDFKEEDWGNRIRKIHIRGIMTFMKTPTLGWVFSDEKELERINSLIGEEVGKSKEKRDVDTAETFFYNRNGDQQESYQQVLKPIFNLLPRNPGQKTSGRYEFDDIKYIKLNGILVGIRGFDYEYESDQSIFHSIIDEGEKIALLLFKVLDGTIDKIIFDQDLDKWTFNANGEVIEKNRNDDKII
ncbi:restriction endonuclease [Fictibacillus sp. KU28468]|uniref:restriction endonuclease n=1 Tax=Fictibacillus sp. KU28468 TaxID=2991053 RepID=UPI00223CFF3F|nr:restriction endonuclease [Fictibacillus sp. KU28468]UZJ80565.1 restriction endonuclease [Fictibacillus sp. KU28468]